MTADDGQASADQRPRQFGTTAHDAPSRLTMAVGRELGGVVVTVQGEIDPLGCELLERVLTDLIDGQGNLLVAVDLAQAVVEPEALAVFIAAAQRARRRGTTFALNEPPTGTRRALQSAGLTDFVEVRTGRAGGAVDVSSSTTGASRRRRERRVTPAGVGSARNRRTDRG